MACTSSVVTAVRVERGDKLPDCRERRLKLDDRGHRQKHLHKQRAHGTLELLTAAVQEEVAALLEEGKPLLHLLHWKHLDAHKAHALNDADDGRRAVLRHSNLVEKPTPYGMESGLGEHSNDLCVKVSYLLHVLYIGVGKASPVGGDSVSVCVCVCVCVYMYLSFSAPCCLK